MIYRDFEVVINMGFLLVFILCLLTFVIGYASRETENMILKDIHSILLCISGTILLLSTHRKNNVTSEKEENNTESAQDER